ncbi:MAG: exonuclease domain-containing protein [Pirellula sp.]
MASRIAVIDFETANNRPNSACQLGLVVLENWRIVEEREWLIRPQRMYFSPMCIRVHGITARDCFDAPQWDTVWDELFPLLDGCVVMAHNVGFDAAVLQATCQSYEIAVPQFDLQCTRLVSRRSWPGLPSYGLASIAEALNIRFRHHNALEDARACAKVAIAAAEKAKAESMESLEDRLGLTRGRIWVDQIRLPRTLRRSRTESVAEPGSRYQPKLFRTDGNPTMSRTELKRRARLRADAILAGCEDTRPLQGKYVVLMHSLLGLERDDAVSFLVNLGAVVQNKINLQTHYVVVGLPTDAENSSVLKTSSGESPDGVDSTKQLDEVAARNRDGQPIRILSQRQLLACIPSALAIVRGDG